MSEFGIIWNLIELLVALRLIAGNNHYVWGLTLILISKLILKRKNLCFFLFLPSLNFLKASFRRCWHNYSKHRFRDIMKPPHMCFPKENPTYFRRCIKSTVNFFTEMAGSSDEQNGESSDEGSNPKEDSSEHCGERQGVATDLENEKPDVDGDSSTTPEPSSTPQKRKAEAEVEIEMKRSKFGDTSHKSASPLHPGSKSGKKIGGMINRPLFPDPNSSEAAGDRPRLSSDNLGQGFSGAPVAGTSADMGRFLRQVVKSLNPEKFVFGEIQPPVSPPEKIANSLERIGSEESPRNEKVNSGAAARIFDIPSAETHSPKKTRLVTKQRKCYPHKKFRSSRTYELNDSQQCVEGVSQAECRDSGKKGEIRVTQDTNNVVPVLERDAPKNQTSDICREERHVPRSESGTNIENISPAEVVGNYPDILTSVADFRRRKIEEATKKFFKKFEKKPDDPRMSLKKEVESGGGDTGQAEGCSSSLDSTIDPLSIPGPSSGLPQQPSQPGPQSPTRPVSPARPHRPPPLPPTAFHHMLDNGNVQHYREYPGLSLQPFSVKKDANYQKRFYREKKRLVMPVKMGKIIRWCIKVSRDLANDVPKYPISDEDKLPLEVYHKLSEELVEGFTKPYLIARRKRVKRRQIRKLNKPQKKSNSSESSEEELPSDTSSDESVKSCDSKASRSSPHFGGNTEMVSPQTENAGPNRARESAAVVHTSSTTPSQHLQQTSTVQKVLYSYGDYYSYRYPVQPVEIKFVRDTTRSSGRLIFCRDILGPQSDKNTLIRLKPFFEVEEVLEVFQRCPSVSVEEFLSELLISQQLYYRLYFDDTEKFQLLRKHICRCVIPLRREESDDDYELDGDTLKPSTSRSEKSSKSLDVPSTSGISQQQTQSSMKENDGVQQSDVENARQTQKSRHCSDICNPSTSGISLLSPGETWESVVSRSQTRSSSRYPRNNITVCPPIEKPSMGSTVSTSSNSIKPRESPLVAPGTSSQKDIREMPLSEQLEISETCVNTSIDDQFLIQENFEAKLENLDSDDIQCMLEEEQRAIYESLLLSAQCHSAQKEDRPPSEVHNVGNPSCIEHFSIGTPKPETQSPFFEDSGPSTSSIQLPIIIDVKCDVSPRKKHVVWYPPLSEGDKSIDLNRASGENETHSTSEQQNVPQPELSSESTDSAEESFF